MSTKPNPITLFCPRTVRENNYKLDRRIRAATHNVMTLATWKTIKWIAICVGIVTIMQAQGADPFWRIMAVALILAGPEVLEYIAVREDFAEYKDRQEEREDDA